MRRPWLELILGGLLFGLTGCGGDPPPKELSAEEEQEFERQQQEARKGERRE